MGSVSLHERQRQRSEWLAFAADGRVKAEIELLPLSVINKIFERLELGDVPSRVILDFTAPKRKWSPRQLAKPS